LREYDCRRFFNIPRKKWMKKFFFVIILFSPFARIDHANNLIGSLDSIVKSYCSEWNSGHVEIFVF